MRVKLLRAGADGSGFYRINEPARAVATAHPDVEIDASDELDVEAVLYGTGAYGVTEILDPPDVLVLQRPTTQRHHAMAVAAKRQGIALVVDIDDDLHNVHPRNVAVGATDPALNPLENKAWLTRVVELADVVTVSTHALLKYGRNGNGIVVRNRIPQRALECRKWGVNPPRSIGWTGTTKTHPADLQRARGALARTELPMVVVGDTEGVATALGVSEGRVRLASAWTPTVEDYWEAVATGIGIGIAPLEDSKFNRAKSWLKPLEYVTFGIPFVASPLPEYRRIVELTGSGILAHSASSWQRAIATLEDPDNYRAASLSGLRWAEENVLEKHTHEWYDTWVTARKVAG